MARRNREGTPRAYPSHEKGRNAYNKPAGGLDGISGSGESFSGGGKEPGFYGGGHSGPDGSTYHSNFDGGGKNLNQRGMDLQPGKFRKDFNGRTDYKKDRPTKSTERVPELGDRGIPPGIISIDGAKNRGPIVDVAGGESRGIPPMTANPQGIGMTIKGVTTKDPHK